MNYLAYNNFESCNLMRIETFKNFYFTYSMHFQFSIVVIIMSCFSFQIHLMIGTILEMGLLLKYISSPTYVPNGLVCFQNISFYYSFKI